jgi:DNA-binding transcriptional MerR regulator
LQYIANVLNVCHVFVNDNAFGVRFSLPPLLRSGTPTHFVRVFGIFVTINNPDNTLTMYYLPELAKKLGIKARTIRLYAQKKHFPSEIFGNRLSFSEDVYLGLLAHVGQGLPLSTFRMNPVPNKKVTTVKPMLDNLTMNENIGTIPTNEPDNESDNEYILELEENINTLTEEIYQLKHDIRELRQDKRTIHEEYLAHIEKTAGRVTDEFLAKHYLSKTRHETIVMRMQRQIDRMAITLRPKSNFEVIAPVLVQLAEKYVSHKSETLNDQQKARTSNTMDNSYRGGFEPRVNPDAKLKGSIPKQEYYDPETGL